MAAACVISVSASATTTASAQQPNQRTAVSESAPQGAAAEAINTTVDANSQLRWGPYLSSRKAGVTGAKSSFYVECYKRGSDYNDGKHHTNVWYRGVVIDDSTSRTYYDVYSWGGNVNTPHDPPAGLGRC
ncbi:hypothetical protein ACFY7H_24835 [Streptomyces sp. NPDC012794]|uniref:hypothetical protein n=1 Tax=Streptomyces sp. NPDC012794 TaxID=3364850 RepID=UPI0036C915CD